MNQRNARWIFPGERDLAPVEILQVRVDGRAVDYHRSTGLEGTARARSYAGSELWVRLPEDVRTQARLSIHIRQRLPERFGRLGTVGGRTTLAGPWYPLLLDGDSFRAATPHQVRLCVPTEQRFARPQMLVQQGDGRHCDSRTETTSFVPFFLSSSWYVRQLPAENVRVWSPIRLYQAPPSSGRGSGGTAGIRDLGRVDVVGSIERVAREVRRTLVEAGIQPRGGTLDIVLSPSRTELAAVAPGVVVVSDRIFEVTPIEMVRSLHDRALARAIFRWHLSPLVSQVEPNADWDWSEDLRAVVLTDLDTRRQRGELESAEDLISWAGFVPAVDQLLYAPQTAFTDVLFGSVDEPDPFRDAPERARRAFSRGRRLLEHARDRIEPDVFDTLMAGLLRMDRPARTWFAELAPDAGFEGWIYAAERAVNYRLGEVRSERQDEGYVHFVEVIRDGDERIEPVEVWVRDEGGQLARGIWDGHGTRGVVELHTSLPRDEVDLDPRHRLPQDAYLAGGHPLRDDTDHLDFRPPIIQGINISASSDGQVNGLLEFVVRRRYDLENTFGFRLSTGPRAHSGLLRFIRGIGPKRDNNARVGAFSVGVQFDRLRSGFGEDDAQGAYRMGVLLAAAYSDQRYVLDPRAGSIVSAAIRASWVFRDDGTQAQTLTPLIRGNLTIPLGLRSTLVLAGDIAYAFGEPSLSELPGLGGRFHLRGYQAGELLSRGRAFAVAEFRTTPSFLSDLSWNVLHLIWVREIQLAAFTGVGAVFGPSDFRGGVEVGVGVRIHFEYAGIQPGVLVLDLAVPLIRTTIARQGRPPLTFFVAFEQYY